MPRPSPRIPPRRSTSCLRGNHSTSPDLFAAAGAIASETPGPCSGRPDSVSEIPKEQRGELRSDLYLFLDGLQIGEEPPTRFASRREAGQEAASTINGVTNFIPVWVKAAVAIALGFGTMVGWKRIVVTVGEKIGKSHLTYAQGASAELIAMTTIALADVLGLPSARRTSSPRAWPERWRRTDRASRSSTVRNILMAWVLTLPVCVFLGAGLFALGLNLIAGLGIH